MLRNTLAGLAVLVFALACGDGTGTGDTGTLLVSVTTPHTDDGALAVSVQGPGLTNLTPAGSNYRVFWRLVSDDEMQILIFGSITGGPVFSVDVGDARHPDRYTGVVTQAATRSDALHDDLAGYALAFTRVAAP